MPFEDGECANAVYILEGPNDIKVDNSGHEDGKKETRAIGKAR